MNQDLVYLQQRLRDIAEQRIAMGAGYGVKGMRRGVRKAPARRRVAAGVRASGYGVRGMHPRPHMVREYTVREHPVRAHTVRAHRAAGYGRKGMHPRPHYVRGHYAAGARKRKVGGARGRSPWISFVHEVWEDHPGISYKEAMQMAGPMWRKM